MTVGPKASTRARARLTNWVWSTIDAMARKISGKSYLLGRFERLTRADTLDDRAQGLERHDLFNGHVVWHHDLALVTPADTKQSALSCLSRRSKGGE